MISNYCQGMVLLGLDVRGGLEWQSFPERRVITSENAHIPRRINEYMRRDEFDLRWNTQFERWSVNVKERGGLGLMSRSLRSTHNYFPWVWWLSVEAYRDEQLVGGFWGLTVGTTVSVMRYVSSSGSRRDDFDGDVGKKACRRRVYNVGLRRDETSLRTVWSIHGCANSSLEKLFAALMEFD